MMCDSKAQPGLVSVIVPVFNRGSVVGEAVDSALAQTYRPIEVLLVDDGSTDETPEVCKALRERNPGLVRTIRRENGGPGPARETGRQAARGEFLQYLDSDDLLLPEKLEAQVGALRERAECGLAYGWFYEAAGLSAAAVRTERRTPEVPTVFPALLVGRLWHTNTPIVRTACASEAGPWADLCQEEDVEMDARLGATGIRLAQLPRPLSVKRHHLGHRAGGGSDRDPRRMRARVRSHLLVYAHAVTAGVVPGCPEMRHFSRELFLLSRQAAAMGLDPEASSLLTKAGEAAGPRRRALDIALYGAAARVVGWRRAARLAGLLREVTRPREPRRPAR